MAAQQWQYSDNNGETWHDIGDEVPVGMKGRIYQIKPEPPAPEPLPCPHCQASAMCLYDTGDYWVQCGSPACGARGAGLGTVALAVAAWNRRAPCQECAKLIAERDQWKVRAENATLDAGEWKTRAELAEADRGEWKARAEKAERELATANDDPGLTAWRDLAKLYARNANYWLDLYVKSEAECARWADKAQSPVAMLAEAERERDLWREDARIRAQNADFWALMAKTASGERNTLRARLAEVATMLRQWAGARQSVAEAQAGMNAILARAEGREAGQ